MKEENKKILTIQKKLNSKTILANKWADIMTQFKQLDNLQIKE